MGIISIVADALRGILRLPQQGREPGYVDEWGVNRNPTKREMMLEYKSTVYTCANLNAQGVASQTLRLYASNDSSDQRTKRFRKRAVKGYNLKRLRRKAPTMHSYASSFDEILDHPAMKLLHKCNMMMDGFTLMELTQLYQEINGTAYWWVPKDAQGVPEAIWVVPAHELTPIYLANGDLSYYVYGRLRLDPNGKPIGIRFEVDEIIMFKMPNPYGPYAEGMSPLRAGLAEIKLASKQASYLDATLDNRAVPQMLISPKDQIGAPEAERLEKRYSKKFRKGGNGGVLVMESAVDAKIMQFNPADLGLLEMKGMTKEDICNFYGVPVSLIKTDDVNRANADAGHYQHSRLALDPRCRRNAETLTLKYASLFDERLFFCYDEVVPENADQDASIQHQELADGVIVINEVRDRKGMDSVPWGDEPWLPIAVAQPGGEGAMETPNKPGGSGGAGGSVDIDPDDPDDPDDDPNKDEEDPAAKRLTYRRR